MVRASCSSLKAHRVFHGTATPYQQDHIDGRVMSQICFWRLPGAIIRYSLIAPHTATAQRPRLAPVLAPAPPANWGAAKRNADTTSCRGSRPGRRDQANSAGHEGQRAFAGGVEQPFGLQPGFQAQELLEQGPCLARCRLSTTSCRSPRASSDAQTPAQFDQFAIARNKVQPTGGTAKHRAADLPWHP